ncbi:Major facilitator superfamily MFS_1 [uncultured spirochete]|uniref:Major facilitator superfamily MFS_1 n=1 Tax=uncultured spirochete TaxID=156406 RepID=A0A3P3XS32_9SPIR|nr:Major facilitator superfamily MFS_1 [uncultured spirochete]
MEDRKKAAYKFLVLMGIVSLFSDLTYEGARSILGPYLLLLGASASTVGFVSGLGEFIGYALRLVTGYISDKTKRYWPITIIGYAINLIAIPALALAPGLGWVYACGLIVLERFGKAIRSPAKTTLASFAASEVGAGKGFALQEVLDQIGAFIGPLMLFIVLTVKGNDNKLSAYALGFAILAIPAAVTLILLLVARNKYPRPHEFETTPAPVTGDGLRSAYWYYLVGIGFLALGFADFPLMAFHMTKTKLFPDNVVPVLYSVAMGVDALSALFFGRMYDRKGMTAIIISSAISMLFAPLVFLFRAPALAVAGVVFWGIGMGAQESILKSAVTTIVSKERRGTAFGIFNAGFGAFWFVGSWIMGLLYDRSLPLLVIFSVVSQVASLPFFFKTRSLMRHAFEDVKVSG